jgi:hypothetical protein
MKPGVAFLLTMCAVAVQLPGQPQASYGRLAVVATSSTEQGLRIASGVAAIAVKQLSTEKKVDVAVFKEAPGLDAAAATSIARDFSADHLARVGFELAPGSTQSGVLSVRLSPVGTAQGALATVLLLLEKMADTRDEIEEKGRLAWAVLQARMSRGKEVPVFITLQTQPSLCQWFLGRSNPLQTDSTGYGKFVGTQPSGQTKLVVEKRPRYEDYTGMIDIVPNPDGTPVRKVLDVTLRRARSGTNAPAGPK